MAVLTKDQKRAVNNFLVFLTDQTEQFFILDGSAGTGKSFLLQYLLDEYNNLYKTTALLLNQKPINYSIKVTATTNKAAKVLFDALNTYDNIQVTVNTIYSELGIRVKQKGGKTTLENQRYVDLEDTILFIDESSFIDTTLFDYIKMECDSNTKVIFMGDKNQLAPVGLSKSVLNMQVKYRSTLKQVVRNAGNILNTAITFKNAVDTGEFKPLVTGENLECIDGNTFKQLVNTHFLKNTNTDKVKIITWTNAKVIAYNQYIRGILGFPDQYILGEELINNSFVTTVNARGENTKIAVDAKVTIVYLGTEKTKYGIKYREVCFSFKPQSIFMLPNDFLEVKNVLRKLAAEKNWHDFYEISNTWVDLRMPYACSVHKSQGSTYDTVFIDLNDIGKNNNTTEVARLLYVAISRAAKKVYCYGELPLKYRGM